MVNFQVVSELDAFWYIRIVYNFPHLISCVGWVISSSLKLSYFQNWVWNRIWVLSCGDLRHYHCKVVLSGFVSMTLSDVTWTLVFSPPGCRHNVGYFSLWHGYGFLMCHIGALNIQTFQKTEVWHLDSCPSWNLWLSLSDTVIGCSAEFSVVSSYVVRCQLSYLSCMLEFSILPHIQNLFFTFVLLSLFEVLVSKITRSYVS